jgi:hypothetical protein
MAWWCASASVCVIASRWLYVTIDAQQWSKRTVFSLSISIFQYVTTCYIRHSQAPNAGGVRSFTVKTVRREAGVAGVCLIGEVAAGSRVLARSQAGRLGPHNSPAGGLGPHDH